MLANPLRELRRVRLPNDMVQAKEVDLLVEVDHLPALVLTDLLLNPERLDNY